LKTDSILLTSIFWKFLSCWRSVSSSCSSHISKMMHSLISQLRTWELKFYSHLFNHKNKLTLKDCGFSYVFFAIQSRSAKNINENWNLQNFFFGSNSFSMMV
jgi:hypothetical protein